MHRMQQPPPDARHDSSARNSERDELPPRDRALLRRRDRRDQAIERHLCRIRALSDDTRDHRAAQAHVRRLGPPRTADHPLSITTMHNTRTASRRTANHR
jgi:hypothetical protein